MRFESGITLAAKSASHIPLEVHIHSNINVRNAVFGFAIRNPRFERLSGSFVSLNMRTTDRKCFNLTGGSQDGWTAHGSTNEQILPERILCFAGMRLAW